MPGRMFLVDTVQGRIIDDEESQSRHRGPQALSFSWVTQYRSLARRTAGAAQRAAARPSHDRASVNRPSGIRSKS